jgi:predicted deacylase
VTPRRADYAIPVEPAEPAPSALVSNELVVDELPTGELTRMFVELVGDGLAVGVRLPLLVARGRKPGPVFGLTAAVHGNELNGIPVIHELFRSINPAKLNGTLVGVVVVNVPGLAMEQRAFNDGADLNRIMPGKPAGNTSQVFAHRLLERVVGRFDFLVDLHTASFGRANSLYVRADMKHETTARMAYLQRPQIIVHNPARDTTLRGAAMELGIPAITVEIGDPQRFQKKYQRAVRRGLRQVFEFAGLLPAKAHPEGPPPVVCAKSFWMYTDRGGLLEVLPDVTDVVEKGQEVARVSNAFGDQIRSYTAPRDGIVVGRSVNPVGQTGARILHLGIPAQPGQLPLAD